MCYLQKFFIIKNEKIDDYYKDYRIEMDHRKVVEKFFNEEIDDTIEDHNIEPLYDLLNGKLDETKEN